MLYPQPLIPQILIFLVPVDVLRWFWFGTFQGCFTHTRAIMWLPKEVIFKDIGKIHCFQMTTKHNKKLNIHIFLGMTPGKVGNDGYRDGCQTKFSKPEVAIGQSQSQPFNSSTDIGIQGIYFYGIWQQLLLLEEAPIMWVTWQTKFMIPIH